MAQYTEKHTAGQLILNLPKCDNIKEIQDFLGDPESELFLGELRTIQAWSHQGHPWSRCVTTITMKGDTIYKKGESISLQGGGGGYHMTEYTFPFKLDDDDKCFIINAIKCFFNTDAESLVKDYSGFVSLFSRINGCRNIPEEELITLYKTKGAVGQVNSQDYDKHMTFPHILEIGLYLNVIATILMNRKQLHQSISLDEHKGIVRELEEQNKQLKKEYVRFQKERNAAERSSVSVLSSEESLQQAYEKLQTRKNTLEQAYEKLQENLSTMSRLFKLEKKRSDDLEKNIARFETLERIYKQESRDLVKKYLQLVKDNEKLQKELTKTEQVCDEIVEEESQKCKDEIEKLKRQLRRTPRRRIPPPPPGSPNRRTRNRIETVN